MPYNRRAHQLTEQDFHAGERIVTLEGTTPAKKAYTSVQRGREEHFELNSDFVFMNHSCDPNCILNVENPEAMYFEARRGIAKGEALGFFYPSTEVTPPCSINVNLFGSMTWDNHLHADARPRTV